MKACGTTTRDTRAEFFAELSRVQAAADKLPKAEPSVIKDQAGYRFVGVRRHSGSRVLSSWELLGPTGFATGVCFGYWELP